MLTEKDRKYILKEHLRNISHISDKDYQIRVWIGGAGPDFDETVCHFFDDGDPILEKYKDYGITETQYRLLKDFRDEFQVFCDGPAIEHYFQRFLDTPEWKVIMDRAKKVLKEFNYQYSEWTPPN
jgi:hypothetical protein